MEEIIRQLCSDDPTTRNHAITRLQEQVERHPAAMLNIVPALLEAVHAGESALSSIQLAGVAKSIYEAAPVEFEVHTPALLSSLQRFARIPEAEAGGYLDNTKLIFLSILLGLCQKNPALLQESLPVVLSSLDHGTHTEQLSLGLLSLAATQRPDLIAPELDIIFELLPTQAELLLPLLIGVYPYAREAFEAQVPIFMELFRTEFPLRGVLLHLLWEISRRTPITLEHCIVPLKAGLTSPLSASMVCMIYAEVAAQHPELIEPHVSSLKHALRLGDQLAPTIAQIFFSIANLSTQHAESMLAELFLLIKMSGSMAPAIFSHLLPLSKRHPDLFSPYIADLESFSKDNNASLCTSADAILDQLHGRDVTSLANKLEEQRQLLERATHSLDELRGYVDQNVDFLKEFIAQINKKLPLPNDLTIEGLLRKTLTLHFVCSKQRARCMFPVDRPFTTETRQWNRWLKMSFSAVGAGTSLFAKLDTEGAIKKLKECYESYKNPEDEAFLSYISQPFLTSKETDALIEQLREEKFFETFRYDARHAQWDCLLCHSTANEEST